MHCTFLGDVILKEHIKMTIKSLLCYLFVLVVYTGQSNGQSNTNCILPPITGYCEAYFERYYYNQNSGNCEKFVYGGCGGNSNNFETYEQCLSACSSDICTLPPSIGHCKAIIPRFFYNQTSGVCQSFQYGGCGGNSNNFETPEQCSNTCTNICQ